jgi:hypothetical protein
MAEQWALLIEHGLIKPEHRPDVDMNHQPKGGMCGTCVHALRNCSHLPFNTMPPLTRDAQTVIVRCTEFERRK